MATFKLVAVLLFTLYSSSVLGGPLEFSNVTR